MGACRRRTSRNAAASCHRGSSSAIWKISLREWPNPPPPSSRTPADSAGRAKNKDKFRGIFPKQKMIGPLFSLSCRRMWGWSTFPSKISASAVWRKVWEGKYSRRGCRGRVFRRRQSLSWGWSSKRIETCSESLIFDNFCIVSCSLDIRSRCGWKRSTADCSQRHTSVISRKMSSSFFMLKNLVWEGISFLPVRSTSLRST